MESWTSVFSFSLFRRVLLVLDEPASTACSLCPVMLLVDYLRDVQIQTTALTFPADDFLRQTRDFVTEYKAKAYSFKEIPITRMMYKGVPINSSIYNDIFIL